MTLPPLVPLADLVAELRAMRSIPCLAAADRLEKRESPWRDWHLISVREPTIECCSHGRPDHQLVIRQLATVMGYDLPAIAATPEQVWNGLLDEVDRAVR